MSGASLNRDCDGQSAQQLIASHYPILPAAQPLRLRSPACLGSIFIIFLSGSMATQSIMKRFIASRVHPSILFSAQERTCANAIVHDLTKEGVAPP
jgi:hypothetical protein